MDKENLLKLRELLRKDKTKISNNINLKDEYIQVWSKNVATIDDCSLCTAEKIINKKKPASVVADIIINLYVQAMYTFHYFGLEEYVPTISLDVDLFYKFREEMIGNDRYLNIKNDDKSLGDVVALNSGEDFLEVEYLDQGIPKQLKNGLLSSKTYKIFGDLYKTLCESFFESNLIVSFDEFLVELSSRGFYSNYSSFDEIARLDDVILKISTEPFIKENINIK